MTQTHFYNASSHSCFRFLLLKWFVYLFFLSFFLFFSEESSVKRSNCSGPNCFVLKEIFFHKCACQNCTTQQLRIFLKATLGTNFERCGLSWTCISRFKVNWTLQVMLAVLFGFYIFRYGYVSKCVHVFPWWVRENLTMIERFILDAQILVRMMSGWHTGHQITNKSLIHSSCYMSHYNWRGLEGGGGGGGNWRNWEDRNWSSRISGSRPSM